VQLMVEEIKHYEAQYIALMFGGRSRMNQLKTKNIKIVPKIMIGWCFNFDVDQMLRRHFRSREEKNI